MPPRRTYTQTLLPGAAPLGSTGEEAGAPGSAGDREGPTTRRDKAGGDHKLVRTDSRAQTLEAFISRKPSGGENPARAAAAEAAAAGVAPP